MITQEVLKKVLKKCFIENQTINPQEIFETFIDQNQVALQQVESLRNPKTSVCGKKIEQGTLSFQCFDCTPDPHHMFCNTCFILPKHKGHKFVMRHNIGGCCDCGDEKTIDPHGFCADHQGLENVNHQDELSKIPKQLQESIENFLKTIIMYYNKNLQKSNLGYSLGFFKCKNLIKLFNFQDAELEAELQTFKGDEKLIKRQKFGSYLYNMCFNFIEWLIKSNMPLIILVTSMLMQRPTDQLQKLMKYKTDDETFVDLIVKTSAIVDNGQLETRKIDDILYTFHANGEFKSYLQQSLIKQYSYLKILKSEFHSPATKHLNEIYESATAQNIQILTSSEHKQAIHAMLKVYAKELIAGQQKSNTLIEYRADIHSHHTQYVSIELQDEFFFSPYISRFYDSLSRSYNLLTKQKMDTFGIILNTSYWLTLRTQYTFFPDILMSQLKKTLSPIDFELLVNGDLTKNNFIIQEEFQSHFILICIVNSLSSQEPADVYTDEFFDKPNDGLYYALNYLYVQQNVLSVLFNSFASVIKSSINVQFNLNLTIIMLKYSYQELVKRNQIDNNIQRDLKLIKDDESSLPSDQLVKMARLLSMNATSIDRIFIYFLLGTYFQSKMNKKEFLDFLEMIFDQKISVIMNEIWQAVERAIQSYFAAYIHQDHVSKLYNGTQNQSGVNLQSHDLALLKLFLFLSDENYTTLFAISLKKQSCQLQDGWLVRHRLLLDLLLSDQDLLNVCGSFLKELPLDLKNSFNKFIRSVFILKNYNNFIALKQICTQSGISKSLPIQEYILDVCELDGFIRELKLKPQYYDKKVYEPYLLQYSPEVKGAITEKLLEDTTSKNTNKLQSDQSIEPTLGNAIVNDFTYPPDHPQATMGPIRLNLWKQFLKCSEIFTKLFLDYMSSMDSSTEQIVLEPHSLRTMLQTIYAFTKANDVLRIYSEAQLSQLRTLVTKLKVYQNKGQVIQGSEKEQKTDTIFNLIEESLTEKQQMEEEKPVTQKYQMEVQHRLSQKKKLQEKFLLKQQQFQQQHSIEGTMDQEILLYDTCQGCKLQIEPNQEQCIPGLLDQNNNDTYISPILENVVFPFTRTLLSSCKHRFHTECLQSTYINKKMSLAPMWLQISCPVCKQGITYSIPFILRVQDEFQTKTLVRDYVDQTIGYININSNAAQYYFGKYEKISDYRQQQSIIFLEANISIINNLFIDMFVDPMDFFRKGDNEVLANIIQIVSLYKEHFVAKDEQEGFNQYLDIFYKQYRAIDHYVAQQIAVFLGSLSQTIQPIDINQAQYILEKAYLQYMAQKKSEDFKQCFKFLSQKTIQLIFSPKSVNKEQIENMERLSSQNNVIQQNFVDIFKRRLGATFKDFYIKYIQAGCNLCGYYPLKFALDATAEIYLCLLCGQVLCPLKCEKKVKQEYGNLNNHANKYHCYQTIYVSITTGQVVIVVNPITIMKYKNLFYDHLGQKVKILDSKADWNDYKLDERELTSLVDILRSNRLKQVVCNEIQKDFQNFDNLGRF